MSMEQTPFHSFPLRHFVGVHQAEGPHELPILGLKVEAKLE